MANWDFHQGYGDPQPYTNASSVDLCIPKMWRILRWRAWCPRSFILIKMLDQELVLAGYPNICYYLPAQAAQPWLSTDASHGWPIKATPVALRGARLWSCKHSSPMTDPWSPPSWQASQAIYVRQPLVVVQIRAGQLQRLSNDSH